MTQVEKKPVSLFISKSHLTTEGNKTGTWRFLRPRYHEKTAPCGAACPAGQDISRIELLTARGRFKEAWESILWENPFPSVTGRVCHHPCEKACNRREFDEAVAVHVIERFLADYAVRQGLQCAFGKRLARKEKVAVLGAGPGGLAAAYFLARLGYACDVFEAMPEPGGALGWGIPPYRLAAAALKEEIARIANIGVNIQCGKKVSEEFLGHAKASYNAVLLMCGHGQSGRLNVPGESPNTVKDGLAFLQRVKKGEAPVLQGTVAVIGGGNTAVDVARCVVRLGAKAVIICQQGRRAMPAFENEVKMAIEEGVALLEQQKPGRIDVENGELVLTLQQVGMPLGEAAAESPARPGSTGKEKIRVSRIYRALELEAADSWMNPPENEEELLTLPNTRLFYAGQGIPLVYGGDLVSPVKSVAHAVASGKEAALALDVLFQEGFNAILPRLTACMVGNGRSLSMEIFFGGARSERSAHVVRYDEINIDYFQFSPRIAQPRLLKEERIRSFAEVDLRLSASLVVQEASRCFNCGICNECDNCRLFCPDLAVKREESREGRSIDYDYCKGCGICVVECPRNAMSLEEEAVNG